MKRIFSSGAACFVSLTFVVAQDAAVPIGFVNAVGLTSKTDFKIDGQSLKPAGFGQGEYASSFGLSEGSHRFAFLNGDCDKLEANIEIKKGSSPLYVLYNVRVPQKDGKVKNVLKLTGIPQLPSHSGVHFFAFSTLEGRSAELRINDQTGTFQPLKLTPLADGSISIDSDATRPVRIAPREAGNYVVILYEGSDSRVRWAFIEMTH